MSEDSASRDSIIEIRGNQPLILNNPDRVYVVDSQDVDVFAVRIDQNGHAGRRRFLFRAPGGSLLMGLDSGGYGTGISLLLSGSPGSAVREFPRSVLKDGLEDSPGEAADTDSLVAGWIIDIFSSLDQGLPPRKCAYLDPGEHDLEQGAHARVKPGHDLVWVKYIQGKGCYFSRLDWTADHDHYLPATERIWTTPLENARVRCFSQKDFRGIDPEYKALEQLNSDFLRFLQDLITQDEQEEKKRQQLDARIDREVFSNSLARLAWSMDPKQAGEDRSSASDQDTLFAACRTVARKAGIRIVEPSSEALINTDPLQAVAKSSGFRLRRVALKGEWWKKSGGPMLAFIQQEGGQSRPVALIQENPSSYTMIDPGTGTRTRLNRQTNEQLEMFAYLFYRPLPSRALKARDLVSFAFFGVGRDLLMILVLSVAGALLALIPPVATGIIFDSIIPEARRMSLLYIGGILMSAALGAGLFQVTKSVSIIRMMGRLDFSLQAAVMDRVLTLPAVFFRSFSAGDLAERALGINAIRETLSGVTMQSLIGGIFSVFSLGLLFYYSWKLALVALFISLTGVGILSILGYYQVKRQRSMENLKGRLSGLVLQLISGISKLRVSGTEERAFSRWSEVFSRMRRQTYQARIISNHAQAFGQTFPLLCLLTIFGWVVFTPMLDTVKVGTLVAFNSAFVQFQNSMIQMSNALVSSLQVVPLYERARPILESVPEVDESKAGPGRLSGEVEVKNISFRYDPQGALILDSLNMKIHPGQFAAVVGGSGSGKSTLLRLLLGFEIPESGGIYYDSTDLHTLDLAAVRRQLGVVLQNGTVMSGDLFTNIVGSSTLTIDDAWEAARMAGLDQDIKNMPMGMHTVISEGGGTLSGGQRQRLLIARAIAHRPRILFFDEATSALDNATQKHVSNSLDHLNATRVVIAHRLSTIMHADIIFVLHKGRIEEQGTYSQLMKQDGLFAELASRQVI